MFYGKQGHDEYFDLKIRYAGIYELGTGAN